MRKCLSVVGEAGVGLSYEVYTDSGRYFFCEGIGTG